nr:PTI1-like tyrosine-protein kinase At3g15890 [Tanacetum cinerariifolium]
MCAHLDERHVYPLARWTVSIPKVVTVSYMDFSAGSRSLTNSLDTRNHLKIHTTFSSDCSEKVIGVEEQSRNGICCREGQERLIVYDYMANLSLLSYLRGQHESLLDCYLYHHVTPHIIHGDIKASNILLDSDFKTQVADFGFAKLIPEGATHATTQGKGTLGYLAPEYFVLGKASESCNVYSFGILLLELVSGKRPVEKINATTKWPITEWALPLVCERKFSEIADPKMNGKYVEQELKRVVFIGLICAHNQPEKRPTMMEMTTSVGNSSVFRSFFEKQKLTGPNLIDCMGKTVNELHAMLKLHEETLPKKDANPVLHAIRVGRAQKNQKNKSNKAGKGSHGKGKDKMSNASNNTSFASKPKTPPPPKKDNPAKDAICHQCGEVGHWRRNCPMYLAELMKKKKLSQGASTSGSTGKDVISVSRLFDDGFINRFDDNNVISVSKNNLVYFMAVLRDGIYEIDMTYSNTNDSSIRYGYVYLLKHKHEVFETFKVFQKKVENQLGKTIKSLRSDRGGEYMSQEFLDHLKEHGIISHRIPPYMPQNNGVSERRNRTLLDMNAEFFESKLLDLKESRSVEDLELIQEEDTNPSVDTSLNHKEDDQEINEPQSDNNPIRKFSRTRRAPDRMCLYIDAEEHELGDLGEPANYKAALLDPESKKWLDTMNVEMQSMKDNDVWVLVELPPIARTVGSKWLFKKKTDMDGVVYIFKARRVAKGFTQTYGVDYEETFSPVAEIRARRILIAIAAYYDYEIWQMDFKTAFLNGHLSEEVYMAMTYCS